MFSAGPVVFQSRLTLGDLEAAHGRALLFAVGEGLQTTGRRHGLSWLGVWVCPMMSGEATLFVPM
jgi:hypothetical protein